MPRQTRFKNTGKGSFFGDMMYESFLKRNSNHFLVALNNLFDWDSYSAKLLMLYKDRGREGRPPYEPVLIFKLLFISYLFNVSEREVEHLGDIVKSCGNSCRHLLQPTPSMPPSDSPSDRPRSVCLPAH